MCTSRTEHGEEGYLLVGLTVAVFLILLAASIAAPLIAKDLERTKEVEAAHRGHEYQRAIQLFYRKTGHYPAGLEQLDETNNQHFLRRHFVDPLTGAEYRPIALGEQQTKPKGFFGQPLDGLAGGGIGGSGIGSSIGASPTQSSGSNNLGSSGNTSFGSSNSPGGSGISTAGPGSDGAGSTLGGTSASSFQGSKGAIVGVGTNKKGKAIVAVNGEDDFEKWEFLYDPRMDQMKAKASLLGGGMANGGSGTLGNGLSNGTNSINGTSNGSFGNGAGGFGTGTSGTGTGATPDSGGSTQK